jgi:2'-5' RNA ligase superfamily protein
MDLNIALLPDPVTNEALINLNRTISQNIPNRLELNAKDALPHLTLYLARFPDQFLLEVRSRVKAISDRYAPLGIQTLGWRVSKTGSVMLTCVGPTEMQLLHQEVTRDVGTLHRGIASVWRYAVNEFSKDESRLLRTIGFPYGLERWEPHFTVAKTDPLRSSEAKILLDGFRVDCICEKIAVCCTDQNGLVTRVLEAFTLKGKELQS